MKAYMAIYNKNNHIMLKKKIFLIIHKIYSESKIIILLCRSAVWELMLFKLFYQKSIAVHFEYRVYDYPVKNHKPMHKYMLKKSLEMLS